MAHRALIFITVPTKDNPGLPRAFLKVGGISLLERQLRMLKRLGIEDVTLVAGEFLSAVENAKFRRGPEKIKILNLPDMKPEGHFPKGEKVLVLEAGVLIDERIMKAVLAKKSRRAIAVYPEKTVIYGKGYGLKLKTAKGEKLFASAATVLGEDIIKAFATRGFQETPLPNLLKTGLAMAASPFVDISKLPTYLADRRRDLEIMWRPVGKQSETGKATRAQIATAQKGCLDWPARWIHPFFENLTVELISPFPITPNHITLITMIVGFYITHLFWTGQMLLGLILALIIGVLDGVDGKLARTKMEQTKLGEFEHIADKIVEYSWYIGIAIFLAGVEGNALPWALAVLTILFAAAEVVQGEFFRRLTGKQLDDAGKFERTARIFTARRNTIIWGLIPFALMDQWLLGFWAVAIFTAFTFFLAQVRFFIRVREYGSEKSSEIKKNFDDTAYF